MRKVPQEVPTANSTLRKSRGLVNRLHIKQAALILFKAYSSETQSW
jgi:hypothetical protein